MYESKTHFEQIPVETVKKIATDLPEDDGIENDIVNEETQDEVARPEERCWRDLAQKVQQEDDPQMMIGLVQQLIATFDEEQVRKRMPHTRDSLKQPGQSGRGQS